MSSLTDISKYEKKFEFMNVNLCFIVHNAIKLQFENWFFFFIFWKRNKNQIFYKINHNYAFNEFINFKFSWNVALISQFHPFNSILQFDVFLCHSIFTNFTPWKVVYFSFQILCVTNSYYHRCDCYVWNTSGFRLSIPDISITKLAKVKNNQN